VELGVCCLFQGRGPSTGGDEGSVDDGAVGGGVDERGSDGDDLFAEGYVGTENECCWLVSWSGVPLFFI
jgi:hypothetical protein